MNKLYIKSMEEKRDNLVYKRTVVPVGLHYYGITKDLERRDDLGYKRTSLQPYIDTYGWNNISTTIVVDGLTRKEAELLEDKLIKEGWERGDCINKQGSGGLWRDNRKEYTKQYNLTHKEERNEYSRQYRQLHLVEVKEKDKQHSKKYREEHREEIKLKQKKRNKNRMKWRKEYYNKTKEHKMEYAKEYRKTESGKIATRKATAKQRSTTVGKIYNRVSSFNTYHPDRKLITPLEAKEMYLLTGYIPSYIKNDDLS